MSRLVSMFMLWLLLLLAAAPASAVMDVQPRNCTWELPASSYDLAPDVRDGPNLYAYVQQNPWTAFDPDGLALDTIWDIGNVIHDVGRIVKNGAEIAWGAAATGYHKATGNSAAADASWNGTGGDWSEFKQAAGDTALDAGAMCVPFVPAGAQKVVRGGINAYDKIERAEAGVNAVEKASEGDIVGALNDAASAAGTLPGGKKTKIEASARPDSKYSNLPDPRNVASGKDFTRATKKKILEQNREQNGGTVRSDKSGAAAVASQKSQSGVTPPPNEAQIDHIIPKSKGGTNSPSNAQVLTRQDNRDKSDD